MEKISFCCELLFKLCWNFKKLQTFNNFFCLRDALKQVLLFSPKYWMSFSPVNFAKKIFVIISVEVGRWGPPHIEAADMIRITNAFKHSEPNVAGSHSPCQNWKMWILNKDHLKSFQQNYIWHEKLWKVLIEMF